MKKVALIIAVLSLQNVFSQVTLMDTTNQFDYIIITVPEFVSACEVFAQHKENVRDLKTLIVDTTMILNEFNSDSLRQDNIRAFISYAGTYWEEPQPKYFLLVGNLSMIPNHEEVVSSNFSYYSDFRYSQSIYDNNFVSVEFYIGRVPSNNETEIINYFNKVINYESDMNLYQWNNNSLMFGGYDLNGFHHYTANEVESEFPLYIRSTLLFEYDTTNANYLKELFFDYINSKGMSSVWFINYMSFFSIDDVDFLNNSDKPFVSFFMWQQFFEQDGLGGFNSKLLLSEKGSIAGFAFVGPIFWPGNIYQLPLYATKLYSQENKTMGEVLDNQGLYPGIINAKNLWGDPSLKLKYDVTTDIKPISSFPTEYSLEQNYPNPFNPTTVINFSIPVSGNVELKVYNVLGKEVKVLTDRFYNTGRHHVEFDGSELSSGVYLYTIRSEDFHQSRKMILIK